MAENKQVIIDFQIDAGEALQATVALTDKLNQLKQTKKELEAQLKSDSGNQALKEQLAQVNAQIGATASSLKGYQKELTNVVKAGEAETNSLQQQRAVLSNLTAQWDRLSAAEREGVKGTEIANQIKATNDNLMQLEGSTGRFQRNVGNYKSALDGAGAALKGLGSGAGGAIGAIQGLGNAFKALIANPVGAAIAAIAVVVKQLANAFKENDDAGTNLQRAFSAFQPIIDAVKNGFSLLADAIGKVVLGISNVYKAIYGFLIPSYKDAANAADELVVAQDRLEDAQREAAIENAKNNKKIAENNAKVADREKYTAKERIKLLQENAKLEKQNLERTKANAAEEYRIAKAQADRKRKLSDEDKDRLAELQKAMIDAETDYQNSLVSINKKTSAAINEINKEREAAEKAAAERRQKAAEKYKKQQEERTQLQREIEAGVVDAMNEGTEKQLAALKLSYKHQIDDYKKAMKEKPYLAEYYNKLILQAEQKLAKESADIVSKSEKDKLRIKEEIQKTYTSLAYQNTINELNLAEDSYENRRKIAQVQMEKELQDSQDHQDQMLKDFEGTEEEKTKLIEQYERERMLIRKKYQKQEEDDYEKTSNDIMNNFLNNASSLFGDEHTLKGLKAMTDVMIKNLGELVEAGTITKDQYDQVFTEINNKSAESARQIRENMISMTNALSSATISMANALADALAKATGDEEKYQKWKLIISIIDTQIQGALAIMSAINVATPGDPYTVAVRIASAAAAAGSAAIAATAQLVALKDGIPAAPKFAQGGSVSGKGTGTSDDILAWLSNGESVMTARTTKMFAPMLSAMNVAGGGAPLTQTAQNNAMQNMWESAFENMPAPIVSVKEITNVNNKVKLKENISKSK